MDAQEKAAVAAYRARLRGEPGVVASAPGRVNLIGEHTDYNGGWVLPMAISRRTAVAMGDGNMAYSGQFREVRALSGPKDGSWTDYPRGIVQSLNGTHPVSIAVMSNLPVGAGLSSSAALEAATALALNGLRGYGLDEVRLAELCCRVENDYVGVRGGIMDQYISLRARSGTALLLDTQSVETRWIECNFVRAGLSLLICDTSVPRTLAASAYNERRQQCEQAAAMVGMASLRDANESDLERLFGIYRQRARHVVTENARVLAAAGALERHDFTEFGRLMSESHASLRDDYEVSTPELDTFVDLAIRGGALGARLTGAGFGGCAIALTPRGQVQRMMTSVRSEFARRGFQEPVFY